MSLERSPAQEHPEPQLFLTECETANLLRVSVRTLQRWRLTGDGPPFCAFGGRRLYGRGDVMSWAEAQRRRSTSEPPSTQGKKVTTAPEENKAVRRTPDDRIRRTPDDKKGDEP